MCDAVDINASGCDICGNENADPVRLEPLERSVEQRVDFTSAVLHERCLRLPEDNRARQCLQRRPQQAAPAVGAAAAAGLGMIVEWGNKQYSELEEHAEHTEM